MYREICQTDLSEFHPTVWGKSPEVSSKQIYHAVWQLLLYFYREFLSKILSVYKRIAMGSFTASGVLPGH